MMNKPISILLYEDDPGYRASFKLIAQQKRIIVDAVDNVDVLVETLENNPRKHKFVVLDAKAYLHEGQTSQESEDYLHKVFREIKRIAIKQDRLLPYCINTGFADIKLRFNEVLDCPIYEKGSEEQLLQYIWEVYNESDIAKLRSNYSHVMDFADHYFDDANFKVLCSLLLKQKFESNNLVDVISNLSQLRRIVEHTMDIIHREHLHSQSGIVYNRSTRTSDVINYLNKNTDVPPQVFGNVVNILKTASNFGSHTPEQAAAMEDYPTNNTVIGLVYGYFETASWAKKLLD